MVAFLHLEKFNSLPLFGSKLNAIGFSHFWLSDRNETVNCFNFLWLLQKLMFYMFTCLFSSSLNCLYVNYLYYLFSFWMCFLFICRSPLYKLNFWCFLVIWFTMHPTMLLIFNYVVGHACRLKTSHVLGILYKFMFLIVKLL